MKRALLTLLLSALAVAGIAGECTTVGGLPDHECTAGAANPAVTQSTIGSTICRSGWTKTIRPPVSLTNKIKAERMKAYGLSGKPSAFELDHLISLELGGCPTCVSNLWPERWADQPGAPGAHRKDVVESWLKRQVCAGRISLADAQRDIASDWVSVLARMPKAKHARRAK